MEKRLGPDRSVQHEARGVSTQANFFRHFADRKRISVLAALYNTGSARLLCHPHYAVCHRMH